MSNIAIRTSQDVTASIETLHRDLDKVRSVQDLLGKAATDKIKAIETDIAAATEELSEALATEHETARKRLIASFSDISVSVTYPGGRDGMLLSAGFIIRYERLTYNMKAGESLPKQFMCNGFAALPDEAFDYLIEVKPEAIPAEIMALAPGDPRDAFNRYFMAKRRGYLVG